MRLCGIAGTVFWQLKRIMGASDFETGQMCFALLSSITTAGILARLPSDEALR